MFGDRAGEGEEGEGEERRGERRGAGVLLVRARDRGCTLTKHALRVTRRGKMDRQMLLWPACRAASPFRACSSSTGR